MARIREEFRLDDPILVRYADWLGSAVQGDLGYSYITDQPVWDTILQRLPVTFQLAFMATVIALVVAIPLGVIGGYREGKPVDRLSSAAVQIGLSVPSFIVAILIWLFTVQTQAFGLPSTGWNRISDKGLWQNLKTAILPAIALSLSPLAIYTRCFVVEDVDRFLTDVSPGLPTCRPT